MRLEQVPAFCILITAVAGAAPAPQHHQIAADIQRNTIALENAWYRLLHESHSDRKPVLWKFTLAKAVVDRDIHIEIVHSPVIGLWARAWAPDLCRSVHPVEIGRPPAAVNGKLALKLKLTLDLREDKLWREAMENLPRIPAEIEVKAKMDGSRFTGTYTLKGAPFPPISETEPGPENPLAAAEGRVAGARSTLTTPLAANPAHWALRNGEAPGSCYLIGTLLEEKADDWYRRIRSLEVARLHKTDYRAASAAVSTPYIVRPQITFAEASKKDDEPPNDLGLDGLDGLDDLDEPVIPRKKKKKSGKKGKATGKGKAAGNAVAESARILTSIRNRTTTMLKLAEKCGAGTETPDYALDSLDTGDPEFGPWYGEQALEVAKNGANILPGPISEEGLQDWRYVGNWSAFGPFPLTKFELLTPHLPEGVWVGDEIFRVDRETLTRYSGKGERGWQPCSGMAGKSSTHGAFGYVCPPKWFSFNPYCGPMAPVLGYREYANKGHHGLPDSTTYLRCTVQSPCDQQVWAGLGINQRGRIWLGNKLIWQGPSEINPIAHESYMLLRIPFKKGANQLTLRLDVDFSSPYCWLRFCVRGKPRSAAEVKTKADAVAGVRSKLPRDKAVGWRGDGTGVYPGTHPPVAWRRKTMQNVLWRTDLPYFGNATPVPVPGSNKLIVTLDPHWLLCLDKDTGNELWRKAVTLLDLMPEADRKQGWALHEAWWKARQTVDAIPVAEARSVGLKRPTPKWLEYKSYWGENKGRWAPGSGKAKDEREGASPELIALLDKRDELERAEDPGSVQDELNKVLQQIEKLQGTKAEDDPNSPQAKYARLKKAEAAYVKLMREHSHVSGMGGGYWSDYCGWMYATPVTDGKHIWLKTGTDVAACYDLDGNEKWKVQIWGSGGADKTLCSPRLVDGKFIMQLVNNDPNPKKRGRGIKLLALNTATGEKVWETRDLPDHAWNASSPGIATLTNGKDTMKVVITTCGTVLRVDDGKLLVLNPGVQGGFASPLVYDDIVVFGHAGMAPIQYVMHSRDRVGFRRLWAVRGGCHGLLDSGGAIITDGRIMHTAGIGRDGKRGGKGVRAWGLQAQSGPHEGWRAMEGYYLMTGAYAEAIPILRKGGNQWTPASASEEHVYHILGDHIFQGIRPKAPMDMVAITRGDNPLRLANSAIDRTYGAGAIEGNRIYVRGYYGVTCIGYTGDDGRKYEAVTVARNLLDDIYSGPPGGGKLHAPDMARGSIIKKWPYKHPRNIHAAPINCRVLSGQAPHRWWILGPVPPAAAQDAFKASGSGAKLLEGDEKITAAGKEFVWGPVCQSFLKVPGFKSWELEPANFCDIHRMRRVLDLGTAVKGQTGTVLLMTEFLSDKEQIMRLEQTLPGVRVWIGGKQVQHGDRVKFGVGVCQMIAEVQVGSVPEDGLRFSPRLWASDNVKKEAADWTRAAALRRSYFEKVVELAPQSREAARAKVVLTHM